MPTGIYVRDKNWIPWNKGIPRTQAVKDAISKANKGKNNGMFGRNPWNTGKRLPIKMIEKMSLTRIGNTYAKGKIFNNHGEKHHNWKGGRIFNSGGYVIVYQPRHPFNYKKYVPEHRLVVEKQIGRYLNPEEVVHHLDKKTDNRPEMLMAFVNNSSHLRFEHGKKVKPEEIIFDGRKLK
jgi:hypothetical protein